MNKPMEDKNKKLYHFYYSAKDDKGEGFYFKGEKCTRAVEKGTEISTGMLGFKYLGTGDTYDCSYLSKAGEAELKKHSHYYKDVRGLDFIDVYAVCQLFNIDDRSGALQHALKKILVSGERGGGKGKIQDIREAIDSLNRYLELNDKE